MVTEVQLWPLQCSCIYGSADALLQSSFGHYGAAVVTMAVHLGVTAVQLWPLQCTCGKYIAPIITAVHCDSCSAVVATAVEL